MHDVHKIKSLFIYSRRKSFLIETFAPNSENIFNDLCRTKKRPIKIIILGDWQRRQHSIRKYTVLEADFSISIAAKL